MRSEIYKELSERNKDKVVLCFTELWKRKFWSQGELFKEYCQNSHGRRNGLYFSNDWRKKYFSSHLQHRAIEINKLK